MLDNIEKYNLKNGIVKVIVIIAFMILFLCNTVLATNVAKGPHDVLEKKKVAVVGDSYAGMFSGYFGVEDYDYYIFPIGTIYNEMNEKIFMDCLENGNHNYIVFCTGVNDYALGTPLFEFRDHLKKYIEIAKSKHKFLFVHTYMNFENAKMAAATNRTDEYDAIMREVTDEYDNAFYIDLNNLERKRFDYGDGLHYGQMFYDTLLAKLTYLMDAINNVEYGICAPWMYVADNNSITVTGDSYAGTFVRYEKDKKYNMVELAEPQKTIVQNKTLINTAMDSSSKFVLISTGVNDFENQTSIEVFEDTMREYLNHACMNHKTVFLHSYVRYSADDSDKEVKIKDYDNVLKALADEYQNVIYIDVNDFAKEEYLMEDKKHYANEFNDVIYGMVDYLITDINNAEERR